MIKHIWSVLSERISVDQNSNLMSYLTTLEGIFAENVPISYNALAYGSRWYNRSSKSEVLKTRLLVVNPDNKETILVETNDQSIPANSNSRTVIVMDGFTFNSFGQYLFRLQQFKDDKWSLVSEIPFDIILKEKEKAKAKKSKKTAVA